MLDGRRGWRFEDDPMDPCWCFGEAGAARLVATVRNGEFYVHDDDNERDTPFPVGSTLIVLWLDENEPKHLVRRRGFDLVERGSSAPHLGDDLLGRLLPVEGLGVVVPVLGP